MYIIPVHMCILLQELHLAIDLCLLVLNCVIFVETEIIIQSFMKFFGFYHHGCQPGRSRDTSTRYCIDKNVGSKILVKVSI